MTDPPLIPGLRDLHRIGVGGFAEVYRATEEPFDRTVAVKVLSARRGEDDAVRAFERECRALGQVDGHGSIVTVHSAGTTEDGRPYLVMGHESGGSLQDRVDRGERPDPVSLALLGAALADALATAHRAGVLHRDVKPANVLLSATGVPKLSDFGIARLVGETATADGRVTASLLHAPPAQLDGRPATPAADAYSLGSTLATLAMGRPPHQHSPDDSMVALLARIALEPPPDLRPFGLPEDLSAVIGGLMQKDPAARPQDLGHVAQHLRHVADRHRAPHGPSNGSAVVQPTTSPRRSWAIWGATGPLLAVATAAVVAVLAMRDDGAADTVLPLADTPPLQLADGVDTGDAEVLAAGLFGAADLPPGRDWVEGRNIRFANTDTLDHPAVTFDVCDTPLDIDRIGPAVQRGYFAEDPDDDLAVVLGATMMGLTGDGEVLLDEIEAAYRSCTVYENLVAGGVRETTEIMDVQRIPVGPYTGLRTTIRFTGDGQELIETRIVADDVMILVQSDRQRVSPKDHEYLVAVILHQLSQLS